MKKFFAILMTLALMLSLAVPAMAADTYTITINNPVEGYIYAAYQIFKGDLDKASNPDATAGTNAVLSNIQWGDGVNSTAILTALQTNDKFKVDDESAFGDCKNAADVAEVLAANASFAASFADVVGANLTSVTEGTWSFEDGKYKVSGLDAGYYLVKNTKVPAAGAYTEYIVEVVENSTVQPKADVPEVEKKIVEGGQKLDETDANIGDTVTFTLTATMPTRLDGYEAYKVVFHDTLSAGLDFVEGTVKVTVAGEDKTSAFKVTEENGTLTISCDNVLVQGATTSSKIVVTYNAKLNAAAVIGDEGNPNKVYLEYSNDPNWNGTPTEEPTGNTPEDKVEVFTWEIPVFKYTGSEENKTPLAGAGFTLYKVVGETETVVNVVAANNAEGVPAYKVCTKDGCTDHTHATEIVTNAGGKFEIEGLEKGTYYLKETTTPAGYNTCANVTVVIGENGALTQDNKPTTEVGILNQAGATLPETGGMGTTIFYIVGGVMVVAAVVLLVTKKRMSAEG